MAKPTHGWTICGLVQAKNRMASVKQPLMIMTQNPKGKAHTFYQRKVKITHEEARLNIQQGVKDYEIRKFLEQYNEQQEEKDKLFERLFKVCEEYKHTSIGLSNDSEFLNVLDELEEQLK